MRTYCEEKEAVLAELGTDEGGLSSAEAQARLEKHGKNKLTEPPKDSIIKRFFSQMADPMIIILLVAAAISGTSPRRKRLTSRKFANSLSARELISR